MSAATAPAADWQQRILEHQVIPYSVDIPGAMALTALGEDFIREAIKRGDLEAHKQGRKYVIRVAELAAFVDALPIAEART